MNISVLGAIESSATPLTAAQANSHAPSAPTPRPSSARPSR